MRSRFRADEPDVGIPYILKRILRISLLARTVNGEATLFFLFWANHGNRKLFRVRRPIAPSRDLTVHLPV